MLNLFLLLGDMSQNSSGVNQSVTGTNLVCFHQGRAFTDGAVWNITVMEPTYVLCRVVRGNFQELQLSAYSNSIVAPETLLYNHNSSSIYWDLLILLPCNRTNTTKTVTVVAIPNYHHNTFSVSFHVMWDCSSRKLIAYTA